MELSELLSLGAIITDNHDNVFNYRRYAYRRNSPGSNNAILHHDFRTTSSARLRSHARD